MWGLPAGLRGARRALAPTPGALIQQRAGYIHGKPPKYNVGPAESVFVLTVMAAVVLGPSGWILAHLDQYKTRD